MNRSNLVTWTLGLLLALAPVAYAEEHSATIQITRCIVYSERQDGIRRDCSEEARKVCAGLALCELPIGLNLSGGTDLDGNPDTWELVRVDYSCAGKALVNGPHYQSDHATMTLSCGPH